MKVLLIQDVKGIGKRMDLKNVSDGYARNFLIPKKLAVAADEKAITKKSEFDNSLQNNIFLYKEQSKKLEKETLNFYVKAGEKGEVYESITKDKITKALADKEYKDFEINLLKPIKQLGEHQAEVKFPQGIKGKLSITLQR